DTGSDPFERAYKFHHALTQEVAYGSLLGPRRRDTHIRIAEAIEALAAERLAEHYEVLAHHFFEGEVWEKALDYLLKGARKADAAFAFARGAGTVRAGFDRYRAL